MRVLLDECVPRMLAQALSGHEVSTLRAMRWSGLRNGALLARMREHGFDVLVTVDKSLPLQQRLTAGGVAIVVLRARSNRMAHLLPLEGGMRRALNRVQPGQVIEVES